MSPGQTSQLPAQATPINKLMAPVSVTADLTSLGRAEEEEEEGDLLSVGSLHRKALAQHKVCPGDQHQLMVRLYLHRQAATGLTLQEQWLGPLGTGCLRDSGAQTQASQVVLLCPKAREADGLAGQAAQVHKAGSLRGTEVWHGYQQHHLVLRACKEATWGPTLGSGEPCLKGMSPQVNRSLPSAPWDCSPQSSFGPEIERAEDTITVKG